MTPLITKIKALDPRILLADGYNDCLVGVTLRGQEWVALYDASRIVEKLALDMDYEDAMEYFDFNIQGAYLGEKTPIFISMDQDIDDPEDSA